MSYDGLDAFFAILLGWFFFIAIFSIISYIINGLFLSKTGRDLDDESRWMAWVPVVNSYYVGKLGAIISNDEAFFQKFKLSFFGTLIISFIQGAMMPILSRSNSGGVAAVSMLISLVSIACTVFFVVMTYIAWYRIFSFYAPDKATLYIVLSLLVIFAHQVIQIILMSRVVGKGYVSPNKPNINDNYPNNYNY